MDFNTDVKERLANYRRILQVARKPSTDEYAKITKVCALGLLSIGALGFVTYSLSLLFIG
jgi:protein translocase SEC61 complex gamma subunit